MLRKFESMQTKSSGSKSLETRWDSPLPAPLVPKRQRARSVVEKRSPMIKVHRSESANEMSSITSVQAMSTKPSSLNSVSDQDKKLQLTSGMAEEKAALLVRKFFSNSVIDTCKARMVKTETIMEEASSGTEPSSPSTPTPSFLANRLKTFPIDNEFFPPPAEEQIPEPTPVTADVSFDTEELFQSTSETTDIGHLDSDFGSALNLLDTILDSMTDDETYSIRAESSKTLTKRDELPVRERNSSTSDCRDSEHSFQLSDSIPISTTSVTSDSNPPELSATPPSTPERRRSTPVRVSSRTTRTTSSASGSVGSLPKAAQIASHLRSKVGNSPIDRPTKTSAMKDVRYSKVQSEGFNSHAAMAVSTTTRTSNRTEMRSTSTRNKAPGIVRKTTRHNTAKSPSLEDPAVADSRKSTGKISSSKEQVGNSTRSSKASNSSSKPGLLPPSRTQTKSGSGLKRPSSSSALKEGNNLNLTKSGSLYALVFLLAVWITVLDAGSLEKTRVAIQFATKSYNTITI